MLNYVVERLSVRVLSQEDLPKAPPRRRAAAQLCHGSQESRVVMVPLLFSRVTKSSKMTFENTSRLVTSD